VLLKGGHIAGEMVQDTWVSGNQRNILRSERLPGRFRGTGCRLASAIATRLALGDLEFAAVITARAWLITELQKESQA
jgi:hydroxymethylpyrimidine/phosphomethylpyrimidine kinase